MLTRTSRFSRGPRVRARPRTRSSGTRSGMPIAARACVRAGQMRAPSANDDLDLEPLGVLEEQRCVNGAASMGIPIGEQLGPSVQPAVGAEAIQMREVSIAQRQVVEPGPQPIVTRITNVRRLLQD